MAVNTDPFNTVPRTPKDAMEAKKLLPPTTAPPLSQRYDKTSLMSEQANGMRPDGMKPSAFSTSTPTPYNVSALGGAPTAPVAPAQLSVAERIAQAQQAANAQLSALQPPAPPQLSVAERIAQAQQAANAQLNTLNAANPTPAKPAMSDAETIKAGLKTQATRLQSATTMPGYADELDAIIRRQQPPFVNDTTMKGAKSAASTAADFRTTVGGGSIGMKTARPEVVSGTAKAANAAKGLGNLGLKAVGLPLTVADASVGAYNDVRNDDVTRAFGNSMGIENPLGQKVATGIASAIDPITEVGGRLSRLGGYDPSTGKFGFGGDGYGGLKDLFTKDYETPLDKIRAQSGASYDSLINMGMDAAFGKEGVSMPAIPNLPAMPNINSIVAPSGEPVTAEQRAAAAAGTPAVVPGAAKAPNNMTVSVNGSDNTYDLNNFTALGSGIYRNNAKPNEFIGKGTPADPNAPAPKPAYTFQDNGVDARNAHRLATADARSRYDQEIRVLEARNAEGKMGPRDYASARENINRNYNTELSGLQQRQQEQQKAEQTRLAKATGAKDTEGLSDKDQFRFMLDLAQLQDKRAENAADRETKNMAGLQEQLTLLAGADTEKAARYNRLLSSLPDEVRSMGLNGKEGDREFLKQLIPALDRQVAAQNDSANATTGYAVSGAAGALGGAMLLPRVGAGVGAFGDIILSALARKPSIATKGPLRKLLGNRGSGALAGAGAGIATSESLRPPESAVPDNLFHGQINPNDPTQTGLLSGSAGFKDYFTDTRGALSMDIGYNNTFKTPSGYMPKLNADDQATLDYYSKLLKELGIK